MTTLQITYKIVLKSGVPKIKDIPLIEYEELDFQRPSLNGLLTVRDKLYKVIAITPSTNPTGQAVTYYVEEYNGNEPYKATDDTRKQRDFNLIA